MKSQNAKVTAVLLACFLGMSAVGCSSGTDSSSDSDTAENSTVQTATLPLETDENGETVTDASGNAVLASGATDFMVKEIEFTWGNQTSTTDSSTEDPTETNGSSSGNSTTTTAASGASNNGSSQAVTSYAVVTDANGDKTVDENGKVVTEVVTVPANSNSGSNSSSTTAVNGSSSGNNSSGGSAVTEVNQNTADTYVEKLDTFQAYWMDMTKSEDIAFNGDLINVTFKVKDTAPDGNYVIHISDSQYACEFANWDANALVPSITNGCITVGDATPEAQTATNASDFVLTADSVTAQQGDEVTVTFHISDNPGMVAFVLRFQYDCNALEIVSATVGDDCAAALKTGLQSAGNNEE